MANVVGLTVFNLRIPILQPGLCSLRTVSVQSSRTLKKRWNSGVAPRRLVLGLGASLLAQVLGMASSSTSRFLSASARTEGGASAVEQALKNVEWPEQFPFKEEDFQRFDE